jgi:hypothetical protein
VLVDALLVLEDTSGILMEIDRGEKQNFDI